MFKFMNHHYHVYLLGSDKYPNNIKISHSSHMNLCKTFYAWGQFFFRQSFTCKKKKKSLFKKKKKAKSKSFMAGKHENYVNRNYSMLGWQPATRECQQKFSEG